MKIRKYLATIEIVALWNKYNEGFSFKETAKHSGVVYSTAIRWVNTIQSALAGQLIRRVKNRAELEEAVRIIEKQEAERKEAANKEVLEAPSPQEPTQETPWAKTDRLWEELKVTLAEVAIDMADERIEKITELAKKSNIVGFIKSRWGNHV